MGDNVLNVRLMGLRRELSEATVDEKVSLLLMRCITTAPDQVNESGLMVQGLRTIRPGVIGAAVGEAEDRIADLEVEVERLKRLIEEGEADDA